MREEVEMIVRREHVFEDALRTVKRRTFSEKGTIVVNSMKSSVFMLDGR